jgi:flagellar hook assembly protein FlgD
MTTIAAAAPSATSASQASRDQTKFGEDFDAFLKLLTSQLKFQDPLSPMDTNQFTTQLVQFTSVEQQIRQNKNLEALLATQRTVELASASNYIGRTVEANGRSVVLTDGAASVTYTLPIAAKTVSIAIKDADGNLVRTLRGNTGTGQQTIVWDGTALQNTYDVLLQSQSDPMPWRTTDLSNGFGGSRGAGNDVGRGGSSSAPVLASLAGSVHGELSGRGCVASGHQTLHNAEIILKDLHHGREGVGGARGVGDDLKRGIVLLVVHSHHEHRCVLGRRGDEHFFGGSGSRKVGRGLLDLGEDTSGLYHVVDAVLAPRDRRGVLLVVHGHLLAVDDQRLAVGTHLTGPLSVDRVVPIRQN